MNDFLAQLHALEKTNAWKEDSAHSFIHRGVSELLSRDIQLLFQLLYRIDVKESLVKQVFAHSEQTPDIADQLTLLILERLKQKAELRKRYSSD